MTEVKFKFGGYGVRRNGSHGDRWCFSVRQDIDSKLTREEKTVCGFITNQWRNRIYLETDFMLTEQEPSMVSHRGHRG